MKKVLPRTWLYQDGKKWNNAPNQSHPGLRYQNVIALRHGVTRYTKARVDNMQDAFLFFYFTTKRTENIRQFKCIWKYKTQR